jgi:hypothetical protein
MSTISGERGFQDIRTGIACTKLGFTLCGFFPRIFLLDDYVEKRQPYYFVLFGVLLAVASLRVLAWRRRPLMARATA